MAAATTVDPVTHSETRISMPESSAQDYRDAYDARGIFHAATAHPTFTGDGRPKALILTASPTADYNGFYSRSEIEVSFEMLAKVCDVACRIITSPEDIKREVDAFGSDVKHLIILGHGTSNEITLDSSEKGSSIITTSLLAREYFTGLAEDAEVTLFSCSTGKGRNSFADALSHELKRPIKAAHRDIYTNSFGFDVKGIPQLIHEVKCEPRSLTVLGEELYYIRKTYPNKTRSVFDPELVFSTPREKLALMGAEEDFFNSVISSSIDEEEKILLISEYVLIFPWTLLLITTLLDEHIPLHQKLLLRIQIGCIAKWSQGNAETKKEMHEYLSSPSLTRSVAAREALPSPESLYNPETLFDFCRKTGILETEEGLKLKASIQIRQLPFEREPERIVELLDSLDEITDTRWLLDLETMFMIGKEALIWGNIPLISLLLPRLAMMPYFRELSVCFGPLFREIAIDPLPPEKKSASSIEDAS